MDKPISVGDLVQIVRDCGCPKCGRGDRSLGEVHRVEKLANTVSKCDCGYLFSSSLCAYLNEAFAPFVWRLKRIPPLDELEDVKRDEEITA